MPATEYFDVSQPISPTEAERAMARGDVLFVLEVPVDFARLVERRERPAVLLAADATDPTAVSSAFAAAAGVGQGAARPRSAGARLPLRRPSSGAFTGATTPRASPPTTSSPG